MSPVRLKKAAADLGVRWGRTLVTLAGLGFSSFALAAVLGATLVLSNDLDAAYRKTRPPEIILDTGPVPVAAIENLAAMPGVAAVEDRPLVQARIETAPDRWMALQLFVVDNFNRQKLARVRLDRGRWPAAGEGMLIERDAAFFMGDATRAPVRVRLPDGRVVLTPVTGLAFDPGQPQGRMEGLVYGYIGREALRRLGYVPLGSRLLIARNPSAPPAKPLAERAAQRLEAQGVTVRRIEAVDRPRHPHQFQIDAVVAMFLTLGAIAAVMGAVLVMNLVDALMNAEQRVIGVMKALGGRTALIAGDYLLVLALLGLVASGIAAPFGAQAGQGLAHGLAGLMDFEIVTDARAAAIALTVAAGLLIPLVVAWRRVRMTAARPVREALARASIGVGAIPGWVARVLAPLPMIPRLAAGGLARDWRRAALTAAILSLGLAFFMTALNVRNSTLQTVETVRRARPADLIAISATPSDSVAVTARLAPITAIRAIERWTTTQAVLAEAPSRVNPAPLIGVSLPTAMLAPRILEGRWLSDPMAEEVAVTQKLAADLGLRVGRSYVLTSAGGSRRVRLVGVVREFGEGALYAPKAVVDALVQLASGQANTTVISLASHDWSAQKRAARKMSALEEADEIGRIATTGQLSAIVSSHLVIIALVLLMIGAFALVIGAVGVASSISVSVVQRTREIGVLKAIGARRADVFGLFLIEALLIAAMAWGLAVAAAPLLSRAMAWMFGTLIIQYPFDYAPDPIAPWLGLAVGAAVAALSALAPCAAAVRASALTSLRSE